MKKRPAGWLAVMALAYLASHLPFLAPSPEDIDSINFVLGLRHYDPALHQPHPPGYPVYIALGHVSLWIVNAVAPAVAQLRAETFALAIWSALFGAVAIAGAARLFSAAEQWSGARPPGAVSATALWATAVMAACPLFWICGLRPMSDVPGLALALWSQALALEARRDRSRLVLAAFLGAVAGGIRVQTLALAMPLLVLAAIDLCVGASRTPLRWIVTRPLTAFAIGMAAWGVPLLVVTGGIDGYLRALGTQAAEDFAWVDMLWANPTTRKVAFAVYDTLVLPWGTLTVAAIVGGCAGVGAVAAVRRAPTALLLLVLAFVPYVVFHLLFQEVISVRYALPAVPLVAWAAANAFTIAGRRAFAVAVPVVAALLVVAVPGGIAYGRDMHPAFRAIADAERRVEDAPVAASFAHYGLRRALQAADAPSIRFVEPKRQYEWLGAVDYWRGGGTEPIWFFADPLRTDLALFDPQSLTNVIRYRWAVDGRMELSGTRPRGVDLYRITPPGWFAGTGWSLTPETGGVTRATASGPDTRPIEAWIRRRTTPTHIVVGGRHLGDARAPDAEITLAIDDQVIDRWRLTVSERNFLRFVDLPSGTPAGNGAYARLTIRAQSTGGEEERAEVAIRQFDVQDADRVIYGFGEGWHEEEYAPLTGARWRWTSERSVLRVRGPARPVRLSIRGESPMKYFDAPPVLTVSTGDRRLGELRPSDDFEWSVVVPADAWTSSGGAIALAIDRVYLPGPAEGTDDARHLGVRLFEIRVDPVLP